MSEGGGEGLDRVLLVSVHGRGMDFRSGETIYIYIQSDPDLVTPDLVTPRFSDMTKARMSLNRGPTVLYIHAESVLRVYNHM